MFFLFIFLIILLNINFVENRELRFVQAIWRHGDRSPTKLPYPNDIYGEGYWPSGWSQLTDLGVEQLEELGSFFHDRYVGKFVNDSYKSDEVYIQSSDSDRALASAQAFVDGMYKITQCGINGKTRKVPVPIHSIGKSIDDYLLKPTSTDCPEYDTHYKENSSKKLDKIADEYSDLFHLLANVTGYGKGITVKQAGKVGNVQKEIDHGLPQPDWINQTWPQYGGRTTLEIVTEIDRRRRLNEFEEEKLYRLRGGYLLGDWLQRAKNVANVKQKSPQKMILYSSHDGTLLSLLFSLKIADGEQVPYASAIIMEIYETDKGKFEAEIYYRKNKNLLSKIIPGCERNCDVNKLYDLLKPNSLFSLKQVQEVCFINLNVSSSGISNVTFPLVLMAIILLLETAIKFNSSILY